MTFTPYKRLACIETSVQCDIYCLSVSLLGGLLTCPERFPAEQAVKAGEAESTSCGTGPGGEGCVQELELAIWPGRWLGV